ncbi:MAG: YhjD/YihY/BrkB family envelope integrity protein [Candidatus Methylacidiphilales bacterium]|nr:YhjD/YihY/BrkB family envelope integrity protein [Candidatus Methylacidiphilales bacterium]
MRITFFDRFGLIGTYAGALAFYFLLALVPLFILAATLVFHVLHIDIVPQLEEVLRTLLPASLEGTPNRVGKAVQMGTSRGWFTLGFISTLWATASFMNELARAIHQIFADRMDAAAGGWRRWIKSIGLMGVWCGAVVGVAVILLLGHSIRSGISTHWPVLATLASGGASLLRSSVTLLLLFVSVLLTYLLVPRHTPRFSAAAWGALGVSLCWIVMGTILGRALPVLWSGSPLPVAFGSFMVAMFWAYACCWVLLFGALLVARYGQSHP